MDPRDELAARIAAALASAKAPADRDDQTIARRAYELADALLALSNSRGDSPPSSSRLEERELEPRWLEPPYEPAWDLEPRWSRADLTRAAAKRAGERGPGLAAARPVDPAIRKSG